MKLSKRINYRIEHLAFKFAAFIIGLMPWPAAVKAGSVLGNIASFIVYRRFSLAKENVLKAFPCKTEKEAAAIARSSFENAGRIFAEFIKSASISKEELFTRVEIKGFERFKHFIDDKKTLIIHLGHIANWEIMAHIFPLMGVNLSVLAKEIRNPYVNKEIFKIRERYGCRFILHRNPFFSCVKAIKSGQVLVILMDQNMPAGDKFSPFFGRMASVSPVTALLSIKTQTPILPAKVTRRNGKIVVELEDLIVPPSSYSEQSLDGLIAKLNHILEGWITENPGLWLWLHNRWKREGDYYRLQKEKNESQN